MAVAGDAVAAGLIASLARPGRNITGSTFFNPEISAKRLELLKEVLPHLRRVAVLGNPDNPATGPNFHAMERTARALKVELHPVEVRGPGDFERAFAAIADRRGGALAMVEDAMLVDNATRLAELAATHRFPATGFKEFAEAGGLMAYAVDFPEIYRRAAVFVDKLLKRVKPGDLPVERATKFELIINLKTAKALGLTVPRSVLVQADEVIQ
jgi:putative ABC transport system substrate-binding protein